MTTLTELLQDPEKKKAVIEDSAKLVDREVSSKRGLSGMALKTGYKGFKRVAPGILHAALNKLLPKFAPAVDPFYVKAKESGDVRAYFTREADPIAEALLGVTDNEAKRAKNRVLIRLYKGLRGQAKSHVRDAVPGLADLVAKHVG